MSLLFLTKALAARMPAIPKLVLLVLADSCTEEGEAKLTIVRITNSAGCAEHEASKALRQMKGIGLIRGERPANPLLPNQYRIDIDLLDRLALTGMWRRLLDDRGETA